MSQACDMAPYLPFKVKFSTMFSLVCVVRFLVIEEFLIISRGFKPRENYEKRTSFGGKGGPLPGRPVSLGPGAGFRPET